MVRLKLEQSLKNVNARVKSQFHYGSIKTREDSAMMITLQTGLNSTMVRLKQMKGTKCLNLKRSQFHYGSIKTKENYKKRGKENGLNSTMVRLKPYRI